MAREYDGLPEVRYRNRERDRKVAKRQNETEPTHFYHVTTRKLNFGDILEAPEGEKIFLSDQAMPHKTIATKRVHPQVWYKEGRVELGKWKTEWDGKWYVYEVEPIGQLLYGAENKEIQAQTVRVLRFVGDGRSMLVHQERSARQKGKTDANLAIGSSVHGTENVREGKNKVVGHGRMYWSMSKLKQKLKKDKNGL